MFEFPQLQLTPKEQKYGISPLKSPALWFILGIMMTLVVQGIISISKKLTSLVISIWQSHSSWLDIKNKVYYLNNKERQMPVNYCD
jgi:hypothetical protein